MKKLTALVLALVMCFGLVACGSTPAPSSTPASGSILPPRNRPMTRRSPVRRFSRKIQSGGPSGFSRRA